MKYEDMKHKAEDEQDSIELRSEKVRNIIGEIPPFLIRWGNAIIAVILTFLAVCAYLLKLI